jgi:hypothetical protein
MSYQTVTFKVDQESYDIFKEIQRRNGLKIGKRLEELIQTENKNHSEGNDQYKLESFTINERMKAVPMLFTSEIDWLKWALWYCPRDQEFKELKETMDHCERVLFSLGRALRILKNETGSMSGSIAAMQGPYDDQPRYYPILEHDRDNNALDYNKKPVVYT